jgi:hypothetical protein
VKTLKPSEMEAVRREFFGELCRCGAMKQSRQSFCRGCYWKLPGPYRRRLYLTFARGYAMAYKRSLVYLGLDTRKPENRAPEGS